jgi:hypothetical protein
MYGGSDGAFNLTGLSRALGEVAGLKGSVTDGNLCRVILAGRDDVEQFGESDCYWKIKERPATATLTEDQWQADALQLENAYIRMCGLEDTDKVTSVMAVRHGAARAHFGALVQAEKDAKRLRAEVESLTTRYNESARLAREARGELSRMKASSAPTPEGKDFPTPALDTALGGDRASGTDVT